MTVAASLPDVSVMVRTSSHCFTDIHNAFILYVLHACNDNKTFRSNTSMHSSSPTHCLTEN